MLLAILMVISYATPTSAMHNEPIEKAPWHASIAEMLAAGEYEEGVVVVGIDTKNLTLVLQMVVSEGEECYFDAFGIGKDLQPYGFKSGISFNNRIRTPE